MKTLHTLAFYRSDLGEAFAKTPINEIQPHMFPFNNTGVIVHEDLVLFIDDNGDTIILKNRQGKRS